MAKSLLKKGSAEPQRLCRTLGATPSFSDHASSSPITTQRKRNICARFRVLSLPRDYLSDTLISRAMGIWVSLSSSQTGTLQTCTLRIRGKSLEGRQQVERKGGKRLDPSGKNMWPANSLKNVPHLLRTETQSICLQSTRLRALQSQYEEFGCGTPPLRMRTCGAIARARGASQQYIFDTTWKQSKLHAIPRLRCYLEKALRGSRRVISHWVATAPKQVKKR